MVRQTCFSGIIFKLWLITPTLKSLSTHPQYKNIQTGGIFQFVAKEICCNISECPFHCQSEWWGTSCNVVLTWVCGWNPKVWPFKWKLLCSTFPLVLFIMLYKVVLTFESLEEILKCDHSNENYCAALSVVLFFMLCKVALTFESVDEIRWCDHSNEALWYYFHTVLLFFNIFQKWNFFGHL